jgi:sugar fermentation stimulation protein A
LGRSRFDFALRDLRGAETLVEVKSVTLVEDGVALFPDAPTVRGARHLSELEDYVRAGGRALVLFVVQRGDARAVAPNARTDPRFARALLSAARAGVMLRAVRFSLDGDGRASYRGRIEVGSGPRVSS